MARLIPFVLCSIGAHLTLLFLLYRPLSAAPEPSSVFRVSAVMQAPQQKTTPSVDQRESTEEPPEKQTPPPPRPRRPARTKGPAQEVEPSPPDPTPPAVEAPQSVTASEPSPDTDQAAYDSNVQELSGSAARDMAPGSLTSREHRGGSVARTSHGGSDGDGGGEEVCQRTAQALVRQLHRSAPYPTWARSVGLEGRLELSLRVGRDGHPREIRLVDSSGHPGLDRYVVTAVRHLDGLPRGCSRLIRVPVTYRRR